MGRPDYIFRQFRETARCRDAQHGNGVCCALLFLLLFVLRLFSIHNRLRILIGDHILHNRTVSDFQVKS